MKRAILILVFAFLGWQASASAASALTNQAVLIDDIWFGLKQSGGDTIDAHGGALGLDTRLVVDLRNDSSNRAYVICLRNRGFDFKLVSENGVQMPKTQRGQDLSRGPKSLTDLESHFTLVGRGHPGILIAPGSSRLLELGRLRDLFHAPSAEYVLELRMWVW